MNPVYFLSLLTLLLYESVEPQLFVSSCITLIPKAGEVLRGKLSEGTWTGDILRRPTSRKGLFCENSNSALRTSLDPMGSTMPIILLDDRCDIEFIVYL